MNSLSLPLRIVLFATLYALLSPGAEAAKNHPTSTTVNCTPNPIVFGVTSTTSTCTITVSDTNGTGNAVSPNGNVSISTDNTGTLSATSCVLVATGAPNAACSVNYTTSVAGTHNISATYNGGIDYTPPTINLLTSSGSTPLLAQYPSLTITSVTPATGNRGEVVNVTVTGTNFVTGGTTLNLGANITASSVNVVSSTQLTATLTISTAAVTGFRDVTVTNPATGGGGGSATLTNGFQVRNPSPVISSLSPAAVTQGTGAVVVTINGSGFVPESVAWFDGSTRTTTFVNSGQIQMSLLASDTATVGSFNVYVVNPAPGGGTSNTAAFTVASSGGSFDAVESGGAVGAQLYTKLAGTSFSFDILATNLARLAINTSFTGTVKVELMNATDDSGALDSNGCRSTWTTAAALPDQVFSGGNNGRISINTSYVNALRVARFRVSYPATGTATHIGCSSDAFSIRPLALALSSSMNNGSNTGTPILAAGTSFTMIATAIAGYGGTPQLGTATAHTGAATTGTISGAFAAANSGTGVSTGTNFSYSEVGNFRYAMNEVYDNSFTAVDQPTDCTSDFSNSPDGNGRYGCSFGNTANTQWIGRFVPAYFDVTVKQQGCDADGFTYSGQPFLVTVTARNTNAVTTQNYGDVDSDAMTDNAYSKTVTISNGGSTTDFTDNLVAANDFVNGEAGVGVDIDITYDFTAADTPFTTITLRATDPDGVSSSGHIEEGTEIRSGRLYLDNPSAITTQDAVMTVEVQAWQEITPGNYAWDVHADDATCTALGVGAFSFDPAAYTNNLAAGETTVSAYSFNNGLGSLTLSAPGSGNDGSATINVTIDDWLKFDWTGGGAEAPTGKVTFFEIFETEPGFIDRHELIQ